MSIVALSTQVSCPICFEPFREIVQCQKGHSVCMICSKTLSKCPVCNAGYIGTRNYSLEAIVDNLLHLNVSVVGASSPSDALFVCRADNCGELLRHCQMFNHLSSVHESHFEKFKFNFNENATFTTKYTFPTDANNYFYIYIKKSGLFVLTLKVNHVVKGKRPVWFWVQRVSNDDEARAFSFALIARYDQWRVEYEDCVFGEQSTEADIMLNKTCLYMELPNQLKKVNIDLEIFKTPPRTTKYFNMN